jgi:opacity protein-like surface antigen
MRTIVAAITIWILGSVNAWAQPSGTGFNSTVGGIVGGGKTWDDEGQIGTGLLVGFRADRRLFHNTFVEISIDDLRHERTGRFSADGKTFIFTGSIVQRFGRGDAQPYVLGGVGLARHSGTFGFPELNQLSSTKGTSAGVAFGGGVAVRAGTRFEVGPEARFLILSSDTDSGPAFANWIGGRFSVRF